MKRILSVASAIFIALTTIAANKLEFNNIDIEAGGTATVNVILLNQADIAGFQFEMTLPQGLTVATNDHGKMAFKLNSDRTEDHVVSSNKRTNGTISVLAYSAAAEPFYGTSGNILTFQLQADGTYSGSHDVIISDIAICTTTGQYAAEGASTSFTVTAQGNAQQATSIAIDRLYAVMKVGGIATFIAAVSPESASQAVTWTSSDDAIATVDAAGNVTGKSPGIAVITATTTDGSNLKAQAVAIVEKNIVKGDVNDDGKVNITDVNETISIILNK